MALKLPTTASSRALASAGGSAGSIVVAATSGWAARSSARLLGKYRYAVAREMDAAVSGASGARVLCLHTPGCCQAFYWDASEPVAGDDDRSLAQGPVDMARVQASAMKNGGIEILGPPP